MNRTGYKPGWVFSALLWAFALLVLVKAAGAADLAVLRNGFTIRHDHRIVIGATTRLFLSADDSSFTDVATEEITGYEKDLTPAAPSTAAARATAPASAAARLSFQPYATTHSAADVSQVVNSASATFHLDPDLVNSVIHAESGFNSHAISPKGAQGLMQLMPSTASALGVNNAFDPKANVTGGSQYLRELLERYNFDLVKALAAYNAGPERVEQYQGVPPFHETRAYVARIIHDYNQKKIAQEREAKRALKEKKAAKSGAPSKMPRSKAAAEGKDAATKSSALR